MKNVAITTDSKSLIMIEKIESSLKNLYNYIESENYRGYDPYDTLNSWFPFQVFGKWPAILAIQFQKRNPVNIRPLLGVKKFHSTKGMGLLLKAYVKLYKLTVDKKLLSSIKFIKDWLIENRTFYNNDFCWGYDYPYSTPNFVHEKEFPTVVHHKYIMDGFYEYYLTFRDEKVKRFIIESEKFILNRIPQISVGNGICLGYHPKSTDCCYNASLHAAHCLAIVDNLRKNDHHSSLIKDVVNFVISKQKNSGVWYYSLNPETGEERKQVDFHQGFILESLHDIKNLIGYTSNDWEKAIKKGLEFYKKKQFFENGQSLWRLPRFYPVDIHNQAQGIITFCKLNSYDPSLLSFAQKIAEWTIVNMQSKRGYFYYRNFKNYKNKIPYIRWGQAWMLLGLTELGSLKNH
ncbi:MAG TPA: hypothetical protein ENN33_10225 [Ignavibacteria bacterium]|nr:hypothetical protein [Ignavibacteria bacterium]